MTNLIEEINKLSTLEEKCFDGKEHNLVSFVYDGNISDYEKICVKDGCGQIKIHAVGLYSVIGLMHYVDSYRYSALLNYSKKIKEKNKKHLKN